MNLKDAFRFQNQLQSLMSEAEGILLDDRNITEVKVTALHKKVMPEKENETTVEIPQSGRNCPKLFALPKSGRALTWIAKLA